MKELPQISEAEYEVMKIVWKYAPISTNDVVEKLLAVSNWSPKTIQTLLSRLVNKGVLSYYKTSRVFIYTPLISEEEYLLKESNSFLKRFYNGTLNKMVLNFIDQNLLTKEDIDELKNILDQTYDKKE
jgi:BlaI family penicillinase repressor